jgi:hypothetical protein
VSKGQYFFYSSNSSQFYLRGVAYQQGIDQDGTPTSGTATFTDPLADSSSCQRDIPYLQALGTNAIRVYAVDPTKNHDSCMQALDAAGIYVIADLSSPTQAINRANPEWTTDLYHRYTSVIASLAKYDNVIGFFAGNEVTNNVTYTAASTFVKAAVRDCKAFIQSQNYGRWLGVGYATNDDTDTRDNMANFFNCGPAAESVDFYGYNIYEWCGSSTFQASGYQNRTEFFQSFNVPVFFAEYGCNTQGGAAGRTFQETGTLYGSNMNTVWSGGIVYEYFEETNDYGLVSVSGSSVSTLSDYNALQTQVAASGYPTGVSQSSYNPSNSAASCPAIQTSGVTVWEASDTLPPTPNTTTCDCMYQAQQCFPSNSVLSNTTALASLFGTVCGLSGNACAGIKADALNGVYGPYSMCNSTQQLAYALTSYYNSQNGASGACDFSGQAVLVNQAQPSAAASCSAILASGSSAASQAATATAGSASSSSSSKNEGGMGPSRWGVGLGMSDLFIGGYVLVSAGVGAAMVLL